MTGFASKQAAATAKVSGTRYDEFYFAERTKLLGMIKQQLAVFNLSYNEHIFDDFNNKALKAEVAWNDRLIFEMTKKC
jgi:hypothetical protein